MNYSNYFYIYNKNASQYVRFTFNQLIIYILKYLYILKYPYNVMGNFL